jgi:hypothetical protein
MRKQMEGMEHQKGRGKFEGRIGPKTLTLASPDHHLFDRNALHISASAQQHMQNGDVCFWSIFWLL